MSILERKKKLNFVNSVSMLTVPGNFYTCPKKSHFRLCL